MKRIIACLLILGMILCTSACGTTEPTSSPETTSGDTQTQSPESSTSNQEEQTVFLRFENALQKQGISFETTEMAADLIGAEQGFKYRIGEGQIELYLFDEESEAYATALSSQKLTLEGFGDFEAYVVSGVAMLIDGLDESTYTAILDEITK